jgi:uncharacterized protein YmfQ (DUF2313 family)
VIPFSALSDSDFVAGVQGLLPRGRAWTHSLTATLTGLVGGIADGVFSVHQSAVRLLEVESDPAQCVELLPDFETDYGLPDSCSPASPSLVQRRASLLAKIATIGGQSASYYISVAAALGYSITITTFQPFVAGISTAGSPACNAAWRFAWQINAPQISASYFEAGVSAAGDPLWSIGNTELECRIRKIAPAHGVLWFQYH